MLPYVRDIISLLKKLKQPDSEYFAETVLIYILNLGKMSNKDTFIELIKAELSPEVGEKIMTIAE